MTTTTEKLADALRAMETEMSRVHDGYPPSTASAAVDSVRQRARATLAEYDAERQEVSRKGLTARAWIEKARDTLDRRTREEDDTDLIDAHDDLCNALAMLDTERQPSPARVVAARELHMAGFYIGPRDPSRNRAFTGAWMIAQDLHDITTQDASVGGYCIVGDDLGELLSEAVKELGK